MTNELQAWFCCCSTVVSNLGFGTPTGNCRTHVRGHKMSNNRKGENNTYFHFRKFFHSFLFSYIIQVKQRKKSLLVITSRDILYATSIQLLQYALLIAYYFEGSQTKKVRKSLYKPQIEFRFEAGVYFSCLIGYFQCQKARG